jgi:hypothetical protein
VRDPRQELADLVELLDEVGSLAAALDADLGAEPGTGPEKDAQEERAVFTARATIAANRAREMRAGLAAIRDDARRLVLDARATIARAQRPGEADRDTDTPMVTRSDLPACEHGTPTDVERAGAVLARTRPDDPGEVLRRSLEAARTAVPSARWTGLVGRDGDGRLVVLAGDDVLAALVAAEAGEDDGGRLVAALPPDPAAVTAVHLAAPPAGPRAAALGVASVLVLCPPSLPTERHDASGSWPVALVLAAPEPDAFAAAARAAGRAVALQIGLLLTAARRVSGLYAALEGRDLIGQAKGIVMQRDGVDADTAFGRLVDASQYANLKLQAVARWLVEETAQARNVALGEQP